MIDIVERLAISNELCSLQRCGTDEDDHISLNFPQFNSQLREPILMGLAVLPNVRHVEALEEGPAILSAWWLQIESVEESGLVRFRFEGPTAEDRAMAINRLLHALAWFPVIFRVALRRRLQNE